MFNKKAKHFLILLALLAGLPPFSTHVLLPALPSMAEYFNVAANQMLIVISIGFAGLLLGLIVWGPVSDAYGRKSTLAFGTLIYSVSTLICTFTHSMTTLIVLLFSQAFAEAAILISAYAIARDCFVDKKLTDMLGFDCHDVNACSF